MKKINGIIVILAALMYAHTSVYSGGGEPDGFVTVPDNHSMLPAFQNEKKRDRIFWSNQPLLTFADFKADTKSDPMFSEDFSEDIRVLAKIRKTILVQRRTVGRMIKFKVYAAMIRDMSWIKNPNDTASLIHEQAHYDICEIYARMLRRELIKAKSMDEAKKMFDRISNAEIVEQNLFDAENSGYKSGVRPEWDEKIKKRLRELDVYRDPVIVISAKD
jgi:vacuolar-type H+-ATPase catalytic subunit A/Vma1